MSEDGILTHLWFHPEPEEGVAYDWDNDAVYLGHVAGLGTGEWGTNTSVKFATSVQPCTASEFAAGVDGRGDSMSSTVTLAYFPEDIGIWTGDAIVTGEAPNQISFERRTGLTDLSGNAGVDGKYIRFTNNVIALITSVIGQDPGTEEWTLEVDSVAGVVQGPAVISSAVTKAQQQAWWRQLMAELVELGTVGRVRIVVCDKARGGAIEQQIGYEEYECVLKTANLGKVIPNQNSETPTTGYTIAIDYWPVTSSDSGTSGSIRNFAASDKTYADKIVLTWSAVAYATRYQIYASTDEEAAENLSAASGSVPYAAGTLDATMRLVGEIPASDWDVGAYYLSLGFVHSGGFYGGVSGIPYDGSSAVKRSYYGYSGTNPLSADMHVYYWIRALVDGEWTELTGPAHGVTSYS